MELSQGCKFTVRMQRGRKRLVALFSILKPISALPTVDLTRPPLGLLPNHLHEGNSSQARSHWREKNQRCFHLQHQGQ